MIYPSAPSRAAAERRFTAWGRVPEGIVSPLGIDLPPPDRSALPPGLDLSFPYFMALGTIEPRKNLGLLLDVWEEMGREAPAATLPRLQIVGRRGWASPALLARLDALPPGGPVREIGPLPDPAAAALLAGAAALLFPSLAEGYGLPPLEAAARGVPVLCTDLPIYRENLGDYPVYLPAADRYPWGKAINDLAIGARPAADRKHALDVPSWSDHFKPVLRLT